MAHPQAMPHPLSRYKPDWPAAILSGAIAGAAFIILEMIMLPIFMGASPWAPVRMMAAIVMGREVLPPPATFAPVITMVAMVVHFGLSIIYALIFDATTERLRLAPTVLAGAFAGLLYRVLPLVRRGPQLGQHLRPRGVRHRGGDLLQGDLEVPGQAASGRRGKAEC